LKVIPTVILQETEYCHITKHAGIYTSKKSMGSWAIRIHRGSTIKK
jgi:hypothetical protein